MPLKRDVFIPYFNPTEKTIIYSALEEAADNIRRFYCFSPREWFNYCYDLKTVLESGQKRANKKAFAEVKRYSPVLERASLFPPERYQICLFDYNIMRTLWKQAGVEFYPFMIYILTHELVHIARFCQNLHPFDCDDESLRKEEEKVNKLTQQVLAVHKSPTFNQLSALFPIG